MVNSEKPCGFSNVAIKALFSFFTVATYSKPLCCTNNLAVLVTKPAGSGMFTVVLFLMVSSLVATTFEASAPSFLPTTTMSIFGVMSRVYFSLLKAFGTTSMCERTSIFSTSGTSPLAAFSDCRHRRDQSLHSEPAQRFPWSLPLLS